MTISKLAPLFFFLSLGTWSSTAFTCTSIKRNTQKLSSPLLLLGEQPTKRTAPLLLLPQQPTPSCNNHVDISTTTCSSKKTMLYMTQEQEMTSTDVNVAVDYDALLKYHAAIFIQMGLFFAIFAGLDSLIQFIPGGTDFLTTNVVGKWISLPLFYFFSLKSRTLNPLNNERPNMSRAVGLEKDETEKVRGFTDRVMPSWTPPGVIFPIVWLLIIGPIRAYTSTLVLQSDGGQFFNPALLALMFHLSVGDVWNTMNNAEQRFGASVTGVLCVTASALYAAIWYYTVNPDAGQLLGLPMIWFSIATSLITATWKLNPNEITQQIEPLYPIIVSTKQGQEEEEAVQKKTTFAWFNNNNNNNEA